MVPAFFIAVMGAMLALIASGVNAGNQLRDVLRGEVKRLSVEEVQRGVDAYYYLNNFTFPVSSAALVATPGYEYMQAAFQNPGLIYARTAAPLNDGLFQYNNVAFGYVADAEVFNVLAGQGNSFLTLNRCGANAFGAGPEWCGHPSTVWTSRSERDSYPIRLGKVRENLSRTLQKFSAIYSAGIPDVTAPAVKDHVFPSGGLAPGGARPITEVVGAGLATVSNCSTLVVGGNAPGQFMLDGMVFGCDDLFSADNGAAITYQFVDDQYIALSTITSITKADGTSVIVSQELVAE